MISVNNINQLVFKIIDRYSEDLSDNITMRTLLSLTNKNNISRFFYSNIALKYTAEQHTVSLTLANEKKRNPLSLETIREIHSALTDVSSRIEN